MVVRLYEPFASGTKLRLYIDPQEFVLADDAARVVVIDEFQALGDDARTEIALCKNAPDLATFDQQLNDEESELLDRADYVNYQTRVHQITVADHDWLTPIAVDAASLCGEEVGQEAVRAIDSDPATFWRHSTDHPHVIVFKLRQHTKKIAAFRLLYGANESARERLNDITVRAAKALANIDDSDNLLEAGINPTYPTGISVDTLVEHTLAKKKNKARWIKVEIGNTDNGQNQAQMRGIEFRVETRDP